MGSGIFGGLFPGEYAIGGTSPQVFLFGSIDDTSTVRVWNTGAVNAWARFPGGLFDPAMFDPRIFDQGQPTRTIASIERIWPERTVQVLHPVAYTVQRAWKRLTLLDV